MPAKRKKKMRKKLPSVKKLRYTKIIKEDLLGMSDLLTGEVDVNIEMIWDISKGKENKFVDIFSKTYIHEIAHIIVGEILDELYAFGEESVIRFMLKEEWNAKLRKYYKENALS